MNYLAHAFLSPEDPFIMMGNLWGDLLKPRDYSELEPAILQGVKRHKAIDTFTDGHKAVDDIVKLLRPYQGKYTPVVADVLMDFLLSKYWHYYSEYPIEYFCGLKYHVVTNHLDLLPERLHPRINRMLSHQWLESCKDRVRMDQTLLMLSKRAAFKNNIPDAMKAYDLHQERMDQLFLTFFTDVQQYLNLQSEDLS